MKASGFPEATSSNPLRGYRDLIVWQRAMELVVESYRLASLLPPNERTGLVDQLRRASASIPMNIAEGHGRLGRGEFVHHLSIARGSLVEVETILHIAEGLGLLSPQDLEKARVLAEEVSRMLAVLIRRLSGKGRSTNRQASNPVP